MGVCTRSGRAMGLWTRRRGVRIWSSNWCRGWIGWACTGRQDDDSVERGVAARVGSARREDVARCVSQYDVERLSFRHVDQLKCHRGTSYLLPVDDGGAAEACPFRQNDAGRGVLRTECHPTGAELDLDGLLSPERQRPAEQDSGTGEGPETHSLSSIRRPSDADRQVSNPRPQGVAPPRRAVAVVRRGADGYGSAGT